MKYTVKQLADLSGVSPRTLRYYDQIDLLKPSYITEKNYRIYEEKQVDRLQQILFFRSLDFSLTKVKQIMDDDDYSELDALKQQKKLIIEKQNHLDFLLKNIQKTIEHYKGEIEMTDTEKFTAFKKDRIKNNEDLFGQEIREKYGNEVVAESNKKYGNLTENQFQKMQKMESQLIEDLKHLNDDFDLKSELSLKIYHEHKEWLMFTWPSYTKASHKALVQMYIDDRRFAKYYDDKAGKPITEKLKRIVEYYTK